MEINALIEAYGEKAYAAAYRLTGNRADACDLVQETFLRVMKKAELYDSSFDFGGWLHRVLFRVYLNSRRGSSRRREVALEGAGGESAPGSALAAGTGESPEKIAENNELRERLAAALNALAPDLRACVVLVDMEGCDYEQAAGILGWPVGTVSGRLFRARRLLRGLLEPAREERI
ncbi:MAG: sigma-70 family RNA polymerase sigma factor [Elusimicrobiales bacterium]|nr:sigma-70 family RNA polymerase sigma factor [Elusimicrobiales bacterium]